jgi:hypothetical protein
MFFLFLFFRSHFVHNVYIFVKYRYALGGVVYGIRAGKTGETH